MIESKSDKFSLYLDEKRVWIYCWNGLFQGEYWITGLPHCVDVTCGRYDFLQKLLEFPLIHQLNVAPARGYPILQTNWGKPRVDLKICVADVNVIEFSARPVVFDASTYDYYFFDDIFVMPVEIFKSNCDNNEQFLLPLFNKSKTVCHELGMVGINEDISINIFFKGNGFAVWCVPLGQIGELSRYMKLDCAYVYSGNWEGIDVRLADFVQDGFNESLYTQGMLNLFDYAKLGYRRILIFPLGGGVYAMNAYSVSPISRYVSTLSYGASKSWRVRDTDLIAAVKKTIVADVEWAIGDLDDCLFSDDAAMEDFFMLREKI